MTLTEQVRSFITENFYVDDAASLPDDASLLERGIVDSTGVLEVIAFIEDDLGVTVEDREMLPENLDSIARITDFVTRKRQEAA